MPKYDLYEIPEVEIAPGIFARFIHTENLTIAHFRIVEGSDLPNHSHPHEQTANVITGEFELTVDGEVHHLKPGMVFAIPSGVSHSGRALTNCQIIDVFHPVREDYRDLS
ncbi:MAG: cupin domain-containing protein [Anaerolineales bacterium]|jgi:quercetin dioxygenase-like cupin family protein